MNSPGSRRGRTWLPVALCTLVLPLCTLLIRPWVEIGIIDDFSYIRSAQVLANTGHIAYFGWASAMLGWQLYVGALMIKLLGFSFTAPRVATIILATGAGALLQRLYVRLGVSEWNSAAITIIFLCSPPWLAATFSFMSDVYGIFVLLGCCYCCVRALQAEQPSAATAWVCAAAIGTAVGGTTRQIAWLGVLVMVPCTLWLLRRNRSALWIGGVCTALSMATIPLCIWWFNRQPYALAESVITAKGMSLWHLVRVEVPYFVQQSGFELLFLTAPLMLCFLVLAGRGRRVLLALGLVLLYWAIRMASLYRAGDLRLWGVPYLINNLWYGGWEQFPSYVGQPALLLTNRVRVVLTILVLAGELGLVSLLAVRRSVSAASLKQKPVLADGTPPLSFHRTLTVLGPCTLAYLLLLLPRAVNPGLLDRYLIFPEVLLLALAALLYQRKISRNLPGAVWVLAFAYMGVNAMGMHDTFQLFRAQTHLLQRLQAAGVPRVQLDGGEQFNGWTEILQTGHLNHPLIRIPAGAYRPVPTILSKDRCHTGYLELTPSIHARYVVSFEPNACGGPTGYQETFATWLPPRRQTLYAVKGPE